MHSEPTVFVVDEDAAICELLLGLTRTLGVRCETYTSGLTFVDKVDRYDAGLCGCLVVEARMMGVSGLQIQRRLLSNGITLPVIMMSSREHIPTVVAAIRHGAIDFIFKPFREQRMWEAVQESLRLSRERSRMDRRRKELAYRLENLTARERELCQMIGTGKASRQIAEEMGVCVRTVEIRRAKLMAKLEVGSLQQLVAMAEFAAEPLLDDKSKMSLVGPGRCVRSQFGPSGSQGAPMDAIVGTSLRTG